MASAFEKAFASARKGGKKTFTHNGKSYSTKVAKDTPKKGPVPQSRQGVDKGSGGRATSAKAATPPAKKPAAKPASKPTVKEAMAVQTKPVNKSYAERTKDSSAKTPSKAPRGPSGVQRNASGGIPYKRDDSIMSKATAFIAKVAGRSPAKKK